MSVSDEPVAPEEGQASSPLSNLKIAYPAELPISARVGVHLLFRRWGGTPKIGIAQKKSEDKM